MATLLDIKNFVADLIGTGDGTTSVPKRDRIINSARRKFYSEKKWSFLKKTATLNFTDNEADLSADASDYNYKFDPISIYTYSSNIKFQFTKVEWDDLTAYETSNYVYAIDKAGKKIKISTGDTTVSMEYIYLPTDKVIGTSDDTDEEPVGDITAIGLLSLSMWYLGSRQSMAKYQLFKDEYKEELTRLLLLDEHAIRRFRYTSNDRRGYRRR